MTEPIEPTPQPNNAGAGEKGEPAGEGTQHGGEPTPKGTVTPGTPEPKGAPTDSRIVPSKYNLEIPTDSTLDESHVKGIIEFAKTNKLTNSEAQGILEREHDLKATMIEEQRDELESATEAWTEQTKNDAEIGGDHFDESIALASRVVEKFGTPAFKKALNESGLGNHPELIRIMHRVGKHLKDDSLVFSRSEGGGKGRSLEEVFYGDSKDKK